MSIRTFNIPDETYMPFKKLHRGEMSKLITHFINSFLQINKGSATLDTLKAEIKKDEDTMRQVSASKIKKESILLQLEENFEKSSNKEQELEEEVAVYVRDTMAYYTMQRRLTDIKYEAETAGFKTPEEYLAHTYKEARK